MKYLRAVSSIIFVLVVTITGVSSPLAQEELWTLSIPTLPVSPQEKVVGFEVDIRAGGIASVPSVPMGWNLLINNDPSWHTKIRGSLLVGSAALDKFFFKDFLVIRKFEFMGLKFNVEGVVIVTEDFGKERRIKFGVKDLVLKKR